MAAPFAPARCTIGQTLVDIRSPSTITTRHPYPCIPNPHPARDSVGFAMRFLHSMIRVLDLDRALAFFSVLGLHEQRRKEVPQGRFTLVFVATAPDEPEVELTHNWDQTEAYTEGRNFGHLAFEVDDIYDACERLQAAGITIARPPRDGRMAFVRSPDRISIELLQRGEALPAREPWSSMPNTGTW
jgi:lactoylglutathione lyase